MSKQQIIPITGDINTAGLIIWWTLRGAVDKAELDDSWSTEALGATMGATPDAPGPQTAVHRALNEQRTGTRASSKHRRLHRPLEGNHGRALVDETADDKDLDYAIKATATINAIGRVVVQCDDGDLQQSIEDAYYRHLFNELSTGDISSWLSRKIIALLDGLCLRDGGGFYFIPREHVAVWERVAAAIKGASKHSFYSMSALHADNAVDAILEGIREEAGALAEGSWKKIALGEAGGRALENAANDAVAMRDKVERYEKLLGVSLTEMQDNLQKLRASLAAAALKAHDGEDYTGIGQDFSWAEEV